MRVMKEDFLIVLRQCWHRLKGALPYIVGILLLQLVANILLVKYYYVDHHRLAILYDYSSWLSVVAMCAGMCISVLLFYQESIIVTRRDMCIGKLSAWSNLLLLALVGLMVSGVHMLYLPFVAVFGGQSMASEITCDFVLQSFYMLFMTTLAYGGVVILLDKLIDRHFILLVLVCIGLIYAFIAQGGDILGGGLVYMVDNFWEIALIQLALMVIILLPATLITYFCPRKKEDKIQE